jgi:hypothetical protein
MHIDLADQRELTFYRRSLIRGRPELTILGLVTLPAFGFGAVLLAWNYYCTKRQKLFVSHDDIWFQSAIPRTSEVSCRRDDISKAQIHQSWLQSKFGTGDLIIYSPYLQQPIKVCGIPKVQALKRRLVKHLANDRKRSKGLSKIGVGKAPMAPRFKAPGAVRASIFKAA